MGKKEEKIRKFQDTLLNQRGSFADAFPELLNEWDYQRNEFPPEKYTPKSGQKVWWVCSQCGNNWESSVAHRANGRGCPKCSKKSAQKNLIAYYANQENLTVKYPELAEEWHPTKNGDLHPENIAAGSHQKVWWRCKKCGNEWQSTVKNRIYGNGCPKCAHAFQTSEPELILLYYVQKYFPDAVNGWHPSFLKRYSVDVFIPSLNVAIEYDGGVWHQDPVRDLKKAELLEEHNIPLIRLRESHAPAIEDTSYQIVSHRTTEDLSVIEEPIHELFDYLNKKYGLSIVPDVNIERDYNSIVSVINDYKRSRSFVSLRPELLSEWDYEKNTVAPENVAPGSNKKIWWKCKKGHSWSAAMNSRSAGCGCPYCSGRKTARGETDIATAAPYMLEFWDYEKNTYSPSDLLPKSNKKVFWKCPECGYEWTRKPNEQGKNGCPKCNAIRRVIPGYNDFATLYPELLIEWMFDKNEVDPATIAKAANIRVWWKCQTCGNEWITGVHNRYSGAGCPKCAAQVRAKQKMKPVRNIDTGEEFASINDAAEHYHISPSAISSCIKGKIKATSNGRWQLI